MIHFKKKDDSFFFKFLNQINLLSQIKVSFVIYYTKALELKINFILFELRKKHRKKKVRTMGK